MSKNLDHSQLNLIRHQVLEFLTKELKITREYPDNRDEWTVIGNLQLGFPYDSWDLDTIFKPLISNKEIEIIKKEEKLGDWDDIRILDDGELGWAENKYLNRHNEENPKKEKKIPLWLNLSFKILGALGVLSTIILGTMNYNSNKKIMVKDEEIKTLESELNSQQYILDTLQLDLEGKNETIKNQEIKIDSLRRSSYTELNP